MTDQAAQLHERIDQCSLRHGYATLAIKAPAGPLDPQDAQDVIEWLTIILRREERRLIRHSQAASTTTQETIA